MSLDGIYGWLKWVFVIFELFLLLISHWAVEKESGEKRC